MEVDDDAVQQRLAACLPDLRAEIFDRSDDLEADDLLSVLNDHGLFVVPTEDFQDD